MAGKSLGDLYMTLSARTEGWGEKLKEAADDIEGVASKAAAAMGDISDGFLTVSAAAAGFVAAAAGSSYVVGKEVEKLKATFMLLSEEIAEALLPAVQALSGILRSAVAVFRSMDEGQRKALVSAVLWSAGLGTGIKVLERGIVFAKGFAEGLVVLAPALSRAGTAFLNMGKAMSAGSISGGLASLKASVVSFATSLPATLAGVATTMAGILLPVLAVSAAIAALVLLAGSLYKSWGDIKYLASEAGAVMEEKIAKVGAVLGGFASSLANVFTAVFEVVSGLIKAQVTQVLNFVSFLVAKSASLLAPIARAAKMKDTASALDAASGMTGEKLLNGLAGGGKTLAATGGALIQLAVAPLRQMAADVSDTAGKALTDLKKDVTSKVGGGVNHMLAGTKEMLANVFQKLGLQDMWATVKGMLDGSKGAGVVVDVADPQGARSNDQLLRELAEANAREMSASTDFESGLAAASIARMDAEQAAALEEQRMNLEMAKEDAAHYATSQREANRAGAQSFIDNANATRLMAEEAARAISDAKRALLSKFTSAIGGLTNLIDSAVQGFAAGGPLGAIGAVVGDLLMQSEGFREVMQVVEGAIATVADALGGILRPLQPLVAAVFTVVKAVVDALVPVFSMVAEMVRPLVPPLMVLGQLLAGLAPMLTVLGKMFVALTMPLQMLAGPAMKALFDVLKVVSIVILTVMKAVGSVWNAVVGAVQKVLHGISDVLEWVGIGSLERFANSLDRLKMDTNAMGQAISTLTATTWDSANAQAENTAATLRNAEALKKANEELTNVPAAWKIALRRFQSQDARDEAPPQQRIPPPPGRGTGTTSGTPSRGTTLPPPPRGPDSTYDPEGPQVPDRKDPRDPRRQGATKAGGMGGDSFHLTVVGYDVDEALVEGARFVETAQRNKSQRVSGGQRGASMRYQET